MAAIHELDKGSFGRFLAQLRRERGLTQRDLAEMLFISDKAVSKWERGLSLPDVSLLLPLAEKLGVKTASLYAHVASMDALFTEVGLSALHDQKAAQLAAIEAKDGDAAVLALAESYRAFAKAHAALYQLIMQMPMGKDETLRSAAAMTAEPSMQVLQGYSIGEERRMHWQRVLRGVMHGFVSQEASGYFAHYPVDLEGSYRLAVQCVIDGLHKEAARNER